MDLSSLSCYNESLLYCHNPSCKAEKKVSDILPHDKYDGIITLKCAQCKTSFFLCIYCLNHYNALRSQIKFKSRIQLHLKTKIHSVLKESYQTCLPVDRSIHKLDYKLKDNVQANNDLKTNNHLSNTESNQSMSRVSSLASSITKKSSRQYLLESSIIN